MVKQSWITQFMMQFAEDSENLVFVIRKTFEKTVRRKLFQNTKIIFLLKWYFRNWITCLGFTCPEGREKPWGTNHAVLMGKDVIKEPLL